MKKLKSIFRVIHSKEINTEESEPQKCAFCNSDPLSLHEGRFLRVYVDDDKEALAFYGENPIDKSWRLLGYQHINYCPVCGRRLY